MSQRRFITSEYYALTDVNVQMANGDGGGATIVPDNGHVWLTKLWLPCDLTIEGHWSEVDGNTYGFDGYTDCHVQFGVYANGTDGMPTGPPVWHQPSILASLSDGFQTSGGFLTADLDQGAYWSAFAQEGGHPFFGGDPGWRCSGSVQAQTDMGAGTMFGHDRGVKSPWTWDPAGLPDLTGAAFAFSGDAAPGQRFKVTYR